MINKIAGYFLFSLCSLLFLNTVSFAQMTWNQAGKFNGTANTYLAIPNSSDLTNIDEGMFEMWVCMTAYPQSYSQLLDKYQDYQLAYSSHLYVRTLNDVGSDPDLAGPSLNLNRWYHLAVIFRDTTITGNPTVKIREIYVDGVLAASDYRVYPGSVIGTGTDSLLIGSYGGVSGLGSFSGYMDDVRMWLGHFFQSDVSSNYRNTFSIQGSSNTAYSKCNLNISFQDIDNSGTPFLVSDRSKFAHTVKNNGVTAYDIGSKPSVTVFPNQSIHLTGSHDYLAGPDNTNVSPTGAITMEAWIYPEKTYSGAFSDLGTVICKGAVNANYRLYLGSGNSVYASINSNINFPSGNSAIAPAGQWTHVAFSYDASNGSYKYYINGDTAGSGTNSLGNIVNSTDSIYIGQYASDYFFQGYIDEVRIAGYVKSQSQINDFLFKSMDLGDRPSAFDVVCYNFDGGGENNNATSPKLYLRNGAEFSSSYVAVSKNFPVSPLVKGDNFNFPSAWYVSNDNFRIPMTGTSGSSRYDTINIPYCMGISDVNLFLAVNHTYEKDLTVYLISPSGDSVEMVKGNSMRRGQYVTIFNDQADSSIINDRFCSFLPQIKPFTTMNTAFANRNTKGNWKLRVNDALPGDTGRVYGWGLQFNNISSKPNLMGCNITANQGGFWGGSSQVQDTVRYILHRGSSPYDALDSAIGYENQFGYATTFFANALNGSYYIEIRHRNSLAVWTKLAQSFTQGGTTTYNILSGPSSVYGNDLISINGRWCMYSGDINQDGAINGNDFTLFNQQFGQNGYLASDLNGDGTVNGNDFTIFNTGFGHQTNHP
ncbi:MAG: proprotein convertase P-domain-containing protein [Bacteroidetes bacterium]|nr:proprotein convertase P-domain-containing protein [Bacteroidota bacterium]